MQGLRAIRRNCSPCSPRRRSGPKRPTNNAALGRGETIALTHPCHSKILFHTWAGCAIDIRARSLVALPLTPQKGDVLRVPWWHGWGGFIMNRLRVLPTFARSASVLALATCFVSATAATAQEAGDS